MMHIIVLGAAAGGGVPQWNCGCTNCHAARKNLPLQASQTSLAISPDGIHWFLINAAPDIRAQINATPKLWPETGHLRHSPIAGVFLTNGEVDAIAGLLSLREGSPFDLYGHERVLSLLSENSIFNVLDPIRVPRKALTMDQTFEPSLPDGTPSGLAVTAFTVTGKPAWYLENTPGAQADAEEGDTIGFHIQSNSGQSLIVLTACAGVTPELLDRLSGVDLLFFDGTLWRDDEMIRAGLSQKTGQRMGHISMSGEDGAMAALSTLTATRKVFLHINNSNPVLMHGSPERQSAESAGWEIAYDGMELTL